MNFRPTAIASVALATLMLAGCGAAPTTIGAANSSFLASAASAHKRVAPVRQSAAPQTEAAFVAAVQQLGVTLSPEDLAVLSKERGMKPNGQWASRPAANLTADQNLSVHFLKHGSQFHPAPATAQDYLNQAIATANGQRGTVGYFYDTTSKAKGYQTHIVRFVAATHEMTAVRPDDGAITTYYIDNGLAPSRFVEIPQF